MSEAQEFQSRLNAAIRRIYGLETQLRSFERLSGGASQETWLVKLTGCSAPPSIILRRAPERKSELSASDTIGLKGEAQLIRSAYSNGVPVPEVLHVLDEVDEMGDGFFMSRVEGETIARKILRNSEYRQAKARLPAQCGKALAKIHSIETAGIEALQMSQGLRQIKQYESVYRATEYARPVFDLAMGWLRQNTPAPLPPVLAHGDFRLGNIMVNSDGLVAVLDWELAHIGDPREDISWMCVNSWRFGETAYRLGGFGDLEPLLESYAEAGGVELMPAEIDWWEILGSLKWGIMCMMMYDSFRTGGDSSVERAAIGRRVSEAEIDLINLLEKQQHV